MAGAVAVENRAGGGGSGRRGPSCGVGAGSGASGARCEYPLDADGGHRGAGPRDEGFPGEVARSEPMGRAGEPCGVVNGDMPPSSYIVEIPIAGPRTNNFCGLADAVADKEGCIAWAKTLQWAPPPDETGCDETRAVQCKMGVCWLPVTDGIRALCETARHERGLNMKAA